MLLKKNESEGHTLINASNLAKMLYNEYPELMPFIVEAVNNKMFYYDQNTKNISLRNTWENEKIISDIIKSKINNPINSKIKEVFDVDSADEFKEKVALTHDTLLGRRQVRFSNAWDDCVEPIEEYIDLLLNGNGQKFLENYYKYIDMIYNYRIPLRDIASKGKIKKTIEQYKADCKTLTKAGSKKSRQAWYELVIQNDVKVDVNDTIYYINTGSKKSESDVKRITHQYVKLNDEVVELNNKVRKELILKILIKEI